MDTHLKVATVEEEDCIRYAGRSLPGGEERSATLPMARLSEVLGAELWPGTFNTYMLDEPRLLPCNVIQAAPYYFWVCEVRTEEMVRGDDAGIAGWVMRVEGEVVPSNFLEIVAPVHLRTVLGKVKWPSFNVEVTLSKC